MGFDPASPWLKDAVAKGLLPAAAVAPAPPAGGLRPESEREFQARVIALATANNWSVVHVPRVSVRRGGKLVHLTATVGGVGYVDLTLFRERVLYRELKTDAGVLSEAQRKWRDTIRAAGGDWACWRPRDWELVVEELA